MISPELHAQIRRLFFAEHWRVNTIAAQLGVHHDTVRRAVESERFIRPGTQIRPSALDPYKAFITATLEQYPRLRATRLWAMVRERGYPGLGDPGPALRPHRPARRPRRGLPAPGHARRRAGAGRLGQLRPAPRRLDHAHASPASCSCSRGRAPATRASPSTRRSRVSCAATSRPSPRSRACPARSCTTT